MCSASSSEEKINVNSNEVLISKAEINQRVEELGEEISADYHGRDLFFASFELQRPKGKFRRSNTDAQSGFKRKKCDCG